MLFPCTYFLRAKRRCRFCRHDYLHGARTFPRLMDIAHDDSCCRPAHARHQQRCCCRHRLLFRPVFATRYAKAPTISLSRILQCPAILLAMELPSQFDFLAKDLMQKEQRWSKTHFAQCKDGSRKLSERLACTRARHRAPCFAFSFFDEACNAESDDAACYGTALSYRRHFDALFDISSMPNRGRYC